MINNPTAITKYKIQEGVSEYPIGFLYSDNADGTPQLKVTINGSEATYGEHWVLSLDRKSVIVLEPEQTGARLTIRRDIPLVQESDYQVGRIDPEQIEADFDASVERDQMLDEHIEALTERVRRDEEHIDENTRNIEALQAEQLEQDAKIAQATSDSTHALETANSAVTTANDALGKADDAFRKSNRAELYSELAFEAAEIAKGLASTSEDKSDYAYKRADSAFDYADDALTKAKAAETNAQLALGNTDILNQFKADKQEVKDAITAERAISDGKYLPISDSKAFALKSALDSTDKMVEQHTQEISDVMGDISALEHDKQNKLTAGTNITISADNVISATGGVADSTSPYSQYKFVRGKKDNYSPQQWLSLDAITATTDRESLFIGGRGPTFTGEHGHYATHFGAYCKGTSTACTSLGYATRTQGMYAVAIGDNAEAADNAIQLGIGKNNKPHTFQVRSTTLLDDTGHVPSSTLADGGEDGQVLVKNGEFAEWKEITGGDTIQCETFPEAVGDGRIIQYVGPEGEGNTGYFYRDEHVPGDWTEWDYFENYTNGLQVTNIKKIQDFIYAYWDDFYAGYDVYMQINTPGSSGYQWKINLSVYRDDGTTLVPSANGVQSMYLSFNTAESLESYLGVALAPGLVLQTNLTLDIIITGMTKKGAWKVTNVQPQELPAIGSGTAGAVLSNTGSSIYWQKLNTNVPQTNSMFKNLCTTNRASPLYGFAFDGMLEARNWNNLLRVDFIIATTAGDVQWDRYSIEMLLTGTNTLAYVREVEKTGRFADQEIVYYKIQEYDDYMFLQFAKNLTLPYSGTGGQFTDLRTLLKPGETLQMALNIYGTQGTSNNYPTEQTGIVGLDDPTMFLADATAIPYTPVPGGGELPENVLINNAFSKNPALAIGSDAVTDTFGTAIGAWSTATSSYAVALGFNAKTTQASAIQIGTGTNNEEKSLYIGYGTSPSKNYKLLGSDGLIPAARHAEMPEEDGTYVLKMVKAGDEITMQWVKE